MLLGENLARIKNAGIQRLNISLDSLNKNKFHHITGVDSFNTVWENILKAHDMGFSPIKINAVAIQGLNDDELVDFAELSFKYPFHIRFIEYMPIGKPELRVTKKLLTPEIKERIKVLGTLQPVDKTIYDGPAARFKYPNAKGEIGFISPVSKHFCNICNRLRLTASGKLRPCLLSDRSLDIAGPLRSGCSDAELHNLFHIAVMGKNEKHQLENSGDKVVEIMDQMSSIGG
jgi:cyclic pyranopterin phosphate synthase